MQSQSEKERQKAEQELRAQVEPLLLVPFYLLILAWILYALGRW